jgi:hypothetical protein
MKKLVRSILVLTVLIVAAQPTFACVSCDFQGSCTWGGGLRCKPLSSGCTDGNPCGGGLTTPLASELTVASVEITHDADKTTQLASKQEAAPAVVAEARVEAPVARR